MSALMMQAGDSHELDAIPVSGQGEGHGIVAVLGVHELGGQRDDLIHIRRAGVTDFSAADNDALGGGAVDVHAVHICVYDVEELIGVRLHVRSLILGVTGTLDVGLCTVADQIVFLAVFDVFLKSLMVFGATGRVTVKSDRVKRVQGVGAHAALHAAAHTVADEPGHELLLQQIIHRLVNMGRTVVHRTVGFLYHTDVCVLGIVGGVVALLHHIGTADNPVGQITLGTFLAVRTVNLLTVQVNVGLHLQETSFVLFISSNCHF